MRLWTIDPVYFDHYRRNGINKEMNLALSVINGNSQYSKHSQLKRFNKMTLIKYCFFVFEKIKHYGNYNINNIIKKCSEYELNNYNIYYKINVTSEQIIYESHFLLKKLKEKGSTKEFSLLRNDIKHDNIKILPIFNKIDGPIESFEKVKDIDYSEIIKDWFEMD